MGQITAMIWTSKSIRRIPVSLPYGQVIGRKEGWTDPLCKTLTVLLLRLFLRLRSFPAKYLSVIFDCPPLHIIDKPLHI